MFRMKHVKNFVLTCSIIASPAFAAQQQYVPDSVDIKIGQMIMMGINERSMLAPSDTLRNELRYKTGGIIIFEKNIAKSSSYEQMKKLLSDLQSEAGIPLFTAIDEEGGKVHRLKEKYGFVPMPSAAVSGQYKKDSTYLYAYRLAQELKELGFNLNFAPVADVAINPDNPIIAKVQRSYSSSPLIVAEHAQAFIDAHHQWGIHTTLKHFPGHGSSSTDTHKDMTDVTKQWQIRELIPYSRIIDSGRCDAIISCHVVNCRLDTLCIPSTLSKTINTDLLRDVFGFNGVIFSDDMQMYAISKHYGLEKAIAMAINSGVDVLVFGNNVNASDRTTATQIHAIIRKLVDEGAISTGRIDESYRRILTLKNKTY
jgi:beta-N-acetylhexosaminidase